MDNDIKPILLNVGHVDPDAGWNWRDVRSPFARIYYVTRGSARTVIGGTEYQLLPGHLYLTPPFTLHHDCSDGAFGLYYIHFYDEAGGGESLFDRLEMPVEADPLPGDGGLVARLLEINPGRHLSNIDPGQYDNRASFSRNIADNRRLPLHAIVETRGILAQLMSRFIGGAVPREPEMDPRVRRCISHIHNHISNTPGTAELAGMCCVTPDHLTRLFRRETGLTPTEYINRRKMERAELLVLTTGKMIKDIAGELAIDNVSYFNRLFRRHTGMTPTRYREVNFRS